MNANHRKFSFWLYCFVCAVIAISSCPFAMGQGAVTFGTLQGDIYDKSGAVVGGAKISVISEGTGQERHVTTDLVGHFTVSQLPVGKYKVQVTKEGFHEASAKDVVLNLGAEVSLKFTLELGQVSQTVEVQAEAATVETTKTDVSSVIQETQVRELPLNQRSFTALVTQQPGLVVMTNASGNSTQTPTSVTFAQGSQISADGQVTQSMSYLVDGVNINNTGFGAPGTAAGGDIPGVEGIQEFQVLTHNYSAAYGGSAGSVVSFATRSGTNRIHGSLYEFLRNNAVDAREFFNQASEGKQNPYKRNQFGATFGGPIKKDKTFLFVNYEGLRSRLTQTNIGNVPSVCARNGGVGGNLTGCPEGQTEPYPVTDALGNPVAITPGVHSILNLYPQPNGTDFGNGIAQYIFPNYQPVRQDYGLVRFDQNISAKDTFMARYSVTDASGLNDYFLPTYVFQKSNRLQGMILKWTRTVSNNLVNTLSYGFNRSVTNAVVQPTVPIDPSAYTGNTARAVVGTISVGSATSGNTSGSVSTIGLDNWGPFKGVNNTFPLNDDVIWTKGKHTIRFGGQFVPHQWNWQKGNLNGGGWTFNNLDQLLAGDPAVLIIRQDGAVTNWGFRTKQVAWYLEDAWRVTSRFNVTLGVRHEFQVPILSEVNNRLGNVSSRSQSAPHTGAPYQNYSLKQFSPRIGLSWDPFGNGKTVVRSGFGLFYDFIPLEAVAGEISYNSPNDTLNSFFGAPLAPGYLPPIPFPNCITETFNCTANSGYPGLLTGVLDPVRAPTSAQWNLEVEHELPGKFSLSATYSGSQTWNIMRGIEGNSSLPCSVTNGVWYFGAVAGQCGTAAPGILSTAFTLYAVVFDAHANYNAGTLALNRRFSQGLSWNSSFTWAKAMSESDTNNSGAILLGNASHSENPLNRHADYSESQFSFRRRLTTNAIYELPIGRGKRFLKDANGVTNAILGGWQVSTLAEVRDGIPFSVLAGVGITNVGDTLTYPDRPNILRKNPVTGHISQYFDPLAYQLQTPGYLGTAARNSVVGPGFVDWDMSFGKVFRITENSNLQFRAEFFNIINHPNFDLPANQLYVQGQNDSVPNTCGLSATQLLSYACNPQAGLITRTVGTPREVQFALKYTF